ncbi:MAG: TlpA disulfide reductase family protein [Acidobacteria bacterium]|nr:TlpA disulfide reductase family protein [Acidobacteriota bacterium]
MATSDDSDLERWVDARLAALDPLPKGEPQTERALARLRARAATAGHRPVHIRLMAAGAAALLVAVLLSVDRPRQNGPGSPSGAAPSDSVAHTGANPLPTDERPPRWTDPEVGSGVALSARRPASTPRLVPAAQRAEAPAFTLPALEGGSATLADYAGRVLLLNFWATWCRPCRIEMPWFAEFQDAFAARGFAVLGVSVDDAGREVVRRFLDQSRVDYRIALADSVEQLAPFGPVTVLPTTWLIDRRGRVAATHVGLVDRTVLEADIRQLLAE